MDTTIKTLDITAKEWWDKVNGNSYFSAQITLNFGTDDVQTVYLPFQYGYGDHYATQARELLVKSGLVVLENKHQSLRGWCRDNGVILRTHKDDKCKQAEVKEWGKDPDNIYQVSYKMEGQKRREKSGHTYIQPARR